MDEQPKIPELPDAEKFPANRKLADIQLEEWQQMTAREAGPILAKALVDSLNNPDSHDKSR